MLNTGLFEPVKNPIDIPVGFTPNDYNQSASSGDFQSDPVSGYMPGDDELSIENAHYLNNIGAEGCYDIASNYFDINVFIDSRIGIMDNLFDINTINSHEDLRITNCRTYNSNANPTFLSSDHGTMVSGFGSGRTNNNLITFVHLII